MFSDSEDWRQDDRVCPLVRQYQLTLDAILRKQPGLASCAVRCRRCGIRFLTHPRNADREDLRCEFGCRECHRRELAKARSKKHYQTEQGWWNKKLLNGKRSAAARDAERRVSPAAAVSRTTPADVETASSAASSTGEPLCPPSPPPPLSDPAAPEALEEAPDPNVQLTLEGFTLDEVLLVNSAMLPYLAEVASLLEGRTIGREELLQTLRKRMRQRSFDRLPRREYVLRFLNQRPPGWCER
ncbi:MAG: hypothetical protein ACOYBO_10805 [Azonexus sp.]